jgi:outer membrane receptor protein involved in Fe transport
VTTTQRAETSVEIALTSNLVQSEEVVVDVERTRPAAGATSLVREEITKVPGTRGDLLTAVKSLPGVANTGVFGPEAGGIIIRGSSPADSKILVDGFEIPILYHFQSLQSVLPSELIDDLTYLPGGFGVENGRATGGVVEVTSRRTPRDWGGFAEVSFINGGVYADGPIGEDGGFVLAARRSIIDAILPLVIPDDSSLSFNTLPVYYDYQGKADYDLTPRHRLSLFVLGTDDALELVTTSVNADDPLLSGSIENHTRFTRAIASWSYDGDAVDNTLAISGLTSSQRFNIGADRRLKLNDLSLAARNELEAELGLATLRIGGEVDFRNNEVDLKFPRPPREGDPGPPNFSRDPIIEENRTTNTLTLAGWVAIELRPTSWWTLTPGIRVDGFTRRDPDEYVVQPRISTHFQILEGTKLIASFGRYARPPVLDENLQTNLDAERALQTTLGIEQKIWDGIELQLTGFYTDRSRTIVYKEGRGGTGDLDDAYVNEGDGRTYGGEALLRARIGPFFGWIAYTLARAERRDLTTGDYRLFDFDQTHNFVFVGSLKLGSQDEWQIGARWQYTSGRPYTPVTGAIFQSDVNAYEPEFGAINSARVPGHHQLDVRLDRYFFFDGWKLAAYLDVSNVYLHQQVQEYEYNFDYTELEAEAAGPPILPSLGLRGEF